MPARNVGMSRVVCMDTRVHRYLRSSVPNLQIQNCIQKTGIDNNGRIMEM